MNDLSDFVKNYTNQFSHLYYSTVEKFLRYLGATTENIKEWELVTISPPYDFEKWTSVRWHGIELGKIKVSDESDSTGIRIVIQCSSSIDDRGERSEP